MGRRRWKLLVAVVVTAEEDGLWNWGVVMEEIRQLTMDMVSVSVLVDNKIDNIGFSYPPLYLHSINP